MQVKLISVGARNPEWLEAGISEYSQRIKGNWQFGSSLSEAAELASASNQSQGRAGRIS